jgi:Flp pilus assembly pilin Flp
MRVWSTITAFLWKKDRGQDVAEYCLMTALVALIALGIFWHVSGGLQGMWNSINASLATGNTTTGASPTTGGGLSGN